MSFRQSEVERSFDYIMNTRRLHMIDWLSSAELGTVCEAVIALSYSIKPMVLPLLTLSGSVPPHKLITYHSSLFSRALSVYMTQVWQA